MCNVTVGRNVATLVTLPAEVEDPDPATRTTATASQAPADATTPDPVTRTTARPATAPDDATDPDADPSKTVSTARSAYVALADAAPAYVPKFPSPEYRAATVRIKR